MYNDLIAETNTYRPLLGFFEIKESSIEGQGLFVKKGITIYKGDVIDPKGWTMKAGIFGDVTFHAPAPTHIEVDTLNGCLLYRTPLGGFINHSDEPNCEIRKVELGNEYPFDYYKLTALRDLQEGEEVTVCYGQAKICNK